MAGLFDDGDENLQIGVNSAYATRYDTWREKEELAKLKARYGEGATLDGFNEDSSTSEEEDENAKELTQQLEKDFFKTLSYLKKKDPCIYDGNIKFFEKEYAPDDNKETKINSKDNKPLFLRDYERKIIEEKNGKLSDDEEDRPRPPSPTPVQEQEEIKQSFKHAFQGDDCIDDNDDEVLGGLFEKRKKSPKELKKENDEFREWLKGQQVQLKDKNTETDLKYLHDFWNDPKLDPNEVFLKDYILNKKFLEPEDKNNVQSYDLEAHDSDKGLSEDEATYANQEEFEHKFNFRFEEPDQEFLKRFPRTMNNSMRKPDNRRKEKRKEVKERKETEKERMKEDLKRLKALKRNEIMNKIEKLRQVTGNANFGFEEDDIDGHFDPESYDKRMNELFSQDYYGEEDDADVPELPDIDEELELEKWDDWEGNQNHENSEPHCEDPDFNMDCDYNPAAKFQSDIIKSTKGRKRNKQSKLAQALSIKKPIFDPNDKSFEQYVDEYYGLDYEDVIGDLPCRFKYRKVVPNSFGLTTEEILNADDKELNRWCSVKLAVQRRPEHVEQHDIHKYEMKSRNENYKKKMLPSLYQNEQEYHEEKQTTKKAKKHKKMKNVPRGINDALETVQTTNQNDISNVKMPKTNSKTPIMHDKTNRSKKRKNEEEEDTDKVCHKTIKKAKIVENSCPIEVNKTKKDIASKTQITNDETNRSKKRKNKEEEDTEKVCHKTIKRAKTVDNSCPIDKSKSKKKKKKKKNTTLKESSQKVCSSTKAGTTDNSQSGEKPLTRRKKRNIKKLVALKSVTHDSGSGDLVNTTTVNTKSPVVQGKKRNRNLGRVHNKNVEQAAGELTISDARLHAYGLKPKKFKNYLKYGKTD